MKNIYHIYGVYKKKLKFEQINKQKIKIYSNRNIEIKRKRVYLKNKVILYPS